MPSTPKVYSLIALIENEDFFIHFIYLLMLYPLDYKNPPKTVSLNDLILDSTAFVINVSRYTEFFAWLHDLTINEITDDKKNVFKDYCRYIQNRIERYVLFQQYPHFILPLHQTDLIYNVIKRSVGNIIYSSDYNIEKKKDYLLGKNRALADAEAIIRELFLNIQNALKDEDRLYSQISRSITFEEQFVSCPVVQHFLY